MYKIIDERGQVLHTTDNAASAMQWYENNNDIATDIEPRPSEAELESAQIVLHAAYEKKLATISDESIPTSLATSSPPILLSAAQALQRIEEAQELKYQKGLQHLIEALIEAEGLVEVPRGLSRYEIKKLTELGYYVAKTKAGYSVSANASVIVSSGSS